MEQKRGFRFYLLSKSLRHTKKIDKKGLITKGSWILGSIDKGSRLIFNFKQYYPKLY